MSVKFLDDLPGMDEDRIDPHVFVAGLTAYFRTTSCLARISLSTGNVDWLVQRRADCNAHNDFWVSENGEFIAEIQSGKRYEITACVRNPLSGQVIWERSFQCLDSNDAYFAADPKRLVLCLYGQALLRKIDELPNPACLFDISTVIRLDPATGQALWSDSYPNLLVRELERRTFTELWCRSPQLGLLDLETGIQTILHQSAVELGWSPARVGTTSAVSWHSPKQIGVDWFDDHGTRLRSCVIDKRGAKSTRLCDSGAGLALNLNGAELLWWYGDSDQPLWSFRAKPYVYQVHRAHETDLFVGTDGNGGRLYALDPETGQETLNLKPALGGVGDLSRLPHQRILVAPFRTSKSYSATRRLLVVSMDDRSHHLDYECQSLLGTWQHGAICRTGKKSERLTIVDLR